MANSTCPARIVFRYRNTLFNKATSLLLGSLFIGTCQAFGPQAAHAAGPTPVGASAPLNVPDQALGPADAAIAKDVVVLENRFFCHHYGHDPMEKRLERLELITLGATQAGTNTDRLARLKQSVVNRDKAAAKTIAKEMQKPEGELASKTNYPVLGTLEWRILKKTYASEAIDPRLARMETQLFGLPAQSMSYVDRIERLKKTIGLDLASVPSATGQVPSNNLSNRVFSRNIAKNQAAPAGPLPRARANGQEGGSIFGNGIASGNGFFGNGLGDGISSGNVPGNGNGDSNGYIRDEKGNITGFYQNSQHSWSWPGNSESQPSPNGQQNVFEAMDQMNRQMNEMMRHMATPGLSVDDQFFSGAPGGSGLPGVKPFPGSPYATPNGGGRALPRIRGLAPTPNPTIQITPAQPRKFTQTKQDLPAYTDPNSI